MASLLYAGTAPGVHAPPGNPAGFAASLGSYTKGTVVPGAGCPPGYQYIVGSGCNPISGAGPVVTLGAASPLASNPVAPRMPSLAMSNFSLPDYSFSPGGSYGSTTYGGSPTSTNFPQMGSSPAQNLCIQGCALLPPGARPLCIAGCQVILPGNTGTPSTGFAGCPAGWVLDSSGRCVQGGMGGMMQRVIPGGSTGTMIPGQAQQGAFGIPAETPAQVGTIMRNDGSVGPVFRCRGNLVLGRDNLCYARGSIPRGARKHPPGRKPLLTGGDLRCLSKAQGLRGKIKRAARGAKLYVADRPPAKSGKKRR